MDVSIRNLIIRNGRYYFRCRFPRVASDTSDGMENVREIKISLRTSDLKTAIAVCRLTTEQWNAIIRTGVGRTVTLAEIRRILADYISSNLESHARQLADYGPMCPATRKEGMQIALNLMAHYEREREAGNPEGHGVAQSILREIPHTESDRNLMAQEWTMAQIFLMRMQHDRIAGKRFLTEYNQAIYDDIISGNYRSAEEIRDAEVVLPLNDLVRRYLAEKSPAWKASMRDSVQAVLDELMEYFGADADIRTLRHQNLLDYRDSILMHLPPRRNLKPQYRNIPLRKLAETYHGQTLSTKTVNLRTSKIRGFFIWCVKHEYLDHNPAGDLELALGHKANTERRPYSRDDLQCIFEHLREDRLPGWRPHKLWIPLIALYSGARMNEICQLNTDHIFTVGGIPCMEITDDGNEHASLKTSGSRRIIPIHPVLSALGFLDYVLQRSKVRRSGNRPIQLWGALLYKEKYGYAHDFQKFFSRFNHHYVTSDPKKVFHSFRHNFIDNLKQHGLQESMIAEIVGHSVRAMTFSRYGKEFNPGILLENMNRLDYGIDLFAILGQNPLPEATVSQQISALPAR